MKALRIARLAAIIAALVSSCGVAATQAAASRMSPAGKSGRAVTCSPGSVLAIIGGKVKCLRAGEFCSIRYNRAYRHHGFVCVAGRLHRIRKTPPPPPPPPPPPAQAGHYKGMTSENEDFEFDVTSDGMGVTGLITGLIGESCTPFTFTFGLLRGNLDFGSYTVPIAVDGSFKIDVTFPGTIDFGGNTDPTTDHVTITGHFSGAVAAGSLLETTQFTDQGTAVSCNSNPQTWTVTKTS